MHNTIRASPYNNSHVSHPIPPYLVTSVIVQRYSSQPITAKMLPYQLIRHKVKTNHDIANQRFHALGTSYLLSHVYLLLQVSKNSRAHTGHSFSLAFFPALVNTCQFFLPQVSNWSIPICACFDWLVHSPVCSATHSIISRSKTSTNDDRNLGNLCA